MKYILKLLPLLLIFNVFSTFPSSQKITSLNPYLVKQAIERRAAQRDTFNKVEVKPATHTQKKQAKPQPATKKVTQPVQPQPATPAPIKVIAIQHAQAQVQAQAAEKMNLDQVLVHLEEYVECVFSCIKRFLSPDDKGKLKNFAHEIEACVAKLDNKVLKPLHTMQDPVALKLRTLVQALRQNQCEFKHRITAGYKNAMSLGFALLTVKKEAIASITKELAHCAPHIKESHLGDKFAQIEKKIIDLTHYSVPEIQAIKVLNKRF